MLIQSCPLIAFGETTPELSSQSQNKIQPQNSSEVGTSTPECSGVRGSTARPCSIHVSLWFGMITATKGYFGNEYQKYRRPDTDYCSNLNYICRPRSFLLQ